MNEYEKRKQAIQRHLAGENVTSIVNSLGRSRPWFYNWFKRYQLVNGEDNWFEDQSRAPKTTPTKVSETLEQQVLSIRRELEAKGIAQTGAIAISYELRNRGFDPPEVWTINRILARHRVAGTNLYVDPTRSIQSCFFTLTKWTWWAHDGLKAMGDFTA